MARTAIRIEGLGKMYRLGETHERTLSDQIVRLARRLTGRRHSDGSAPEDFWALRDVNLDIAEGEAVGIVGGNGAGKSTLLKILSRITQPSTGRALVRGRMSSLLEVGTGFHPELTGRENVYLNGTILGMRRAEVARKFDEIVAFSGVGQFIDTPVKRYSSGMYVRLAFAVAAHLEPDVLVIDEVLAVGDAEFQKRCLGKMGEVAREGRTVLFVSHNMAAVQKLCTRAVWLRQGQVVHSGEPGLVIGEYIEAANSQAGAASVSRPGYLFHAGDAEAAGEARVVSVRMLDDEDRPITELRTWDRVRFRIEFDAERAFRVFSAELRISTPDGVVLLHSTNAPDQGRPFSVEPGGHVAEVVVEKMPLCAGEFLIGVALAIPGVEYLWKNDAIARLHVVPKDVFASGIPPSVRRALVVVSTTWSFSCTS